MTEREYVVHQEKMTEKNFREIIQQLFFLEYYMLKNEYISCLSFKTQLGSWKKKNILLMILKREGWHYLTVKKKIVCIIERNNVKT